MITILQCCTKSRSFRLVTITLGKTVAGDQSVTKIISVICNELEISLPLKDRTRSAAAHGQLGSSK